MIMFGFEQYKFKVLDSDDGSRLLKPVGGNVCV